MVGCYVRGDGFGFYRMRGISRLALLLSVSEEEHRSVKFHFPPIQHGMSLEIMTSDRAVSANNVAWSL